MLAFTFRSYWLKQSISGIIIVSIAFALFCLAQSQAAQSGSSDQFDFDVPQSIGFPVAFYRSGTAISESGFVISGLLIDISLVVLVGIISGLAIGFLRRRLAV